MAREKRLAIKRCWFGFFKLKRLTVPPIYSDRPNDVRMEIVDTCVSMPGTCPSTGPHSDCYVVTERRTVCQSRQSCHYDDFISTACVMITHTLNCCVIVNAFKACNNDKTVVIFFWLCIVKSLTPGKDAIVGMNLKVQSPNTYHCLS